MGVEKKLPPLGDERADCAPPPPVAAAGVAVARAGVAPCEKKEALLWSAGAGDW